MKRSREQTKKSNVPTYYSVREPTYKRSDNPRYTKLSNGEKLLDGQEIEILWPDLHVSRHTVSTMYELIYGKPSNDRSPYKKHREMLAFIDTNIEHHGSTIIQLKLTDIDGIKVRVLPQCD